MSYKYTKSGNLDMRYSSSKAYVASGGSRSGPSGGGGGYSSYGGGSSSSASSYGGGGRSSSDLHYTKSGNLDMRYSSSKAHVASGGGYSSNGAGSSSSGYSSGGRSASNSSDLHYTKSGNLDMRYTSSKAHVASGGSPSGTSSHGGSSVTSSGTSDGLHYTKSGNLDMRYSSSKTAAANGGRPPSVSSSAANPDLHYTKSGALDMRFKTSKALMNNMMEKLKINEEPSARASSAARGRVPQHVPTTKQGLPDMRFKAAKEWVAVQSLGFTDCGALPTWLPKLKDGRVDMHKNVVKAFFDPTKGSSAKAQLPPYNPEARRNYYRRRYDEDVEYQRCIQQSRREPIYNTTIYIPDYTEVVSIQESKNSILAAPPKVSSNGDGKATKISSVIKTIEYDLIKDYCTDDRKLGTGGFGTVYRGTWNGKPVAIKKLLMDSLGKAGKSQFVKEVTIMSIFTDHTNLVQMFGYSLEPACTIVMEYVKLGSLSWLIHHCDKPAVEAKIRDGRIKKKLTAGIVSGMIQLHTAGIIHRDLKPQNVLVSEDYTAKIADFGFSSLRGRTASLVGTNAFAADDDILAGTAAYMAPELIDGDTKVTQAADVFAFGIVMNEIIHEEEPYSESFADLAARGPFGAALLAKSGRRPTLNKERVPGNVKEVIEACWNIDSAKRPSFVDVAKLLNRPEMKFPDYEF